MLKKSLEVLDPVFIDHSITNSKVYDKYQFERIGYFSVDPDSTSEKVGSSVELVELCNVDFEFKKEQFSWT